MVCIFVLIYFFYYYFSHSGDYQNNYYGEKLHFIKSFARIGVAAVLSLGMSMVILLPTYYALTFGKTTFSGADIDYTSLTSILAYFKEMDVTSQFDFIDAFAKMLPGGYDTVRPEGLPFLYCGLLPLLTIPLFFLSKSVKVREKVGAGIVMMIMLFIMQNNITDIIWHCFQRPNWLNYRYSFMFIFLVIIFACRGANDLDKAKPGQIAVIGGALLAFVFLLQSSDVEFKISEISFDIYCIWLSILLLIGYLGVLGAYLKPRLKQAATIILCALVCGEALLSGTIYLIALDFDVVISTRDSYVTFMDRVEGLVDDIQESDESFYRMEKTLFRNVCDNMALSMRGVSNSTSTLNATTINFLNQMGYSASSHWTVYKGGTPVNDSLLGMKYLIYDDLTADPGVYEGYLEDPENNLRSFKNQYALSLAYAVNESIEELEVSDYLTPFELMNAMITNMLGSEEPVEVFKPVYHTVTVNNEATSVSTHVPGNQNHGRAYKYDFYEKIGDALSASNLRMRLEMPEDMPAGSNLYFFFESDYPRQMEWTFLQEGDDQTGFFFEGEDDCIKHLGQINDKEFNYALEIDIVSDSNMLYLIHDQIVFWYLDEAVLAEVMPQLARGNMVIDEDYSESHLTGKINVPADCSTVFTTIPYDEGWHVYVDGKEVEINKTMDALISFKITEGTHDIELRYFNDYLKWGIVISLVSLIMAVGIFILDFTILRKRLPAMRSRLEEKLALEAKWEAERAEIEAAAEAAKNKEEGSAPPSDSVQN